MPLVPGVALWATLLLILPVQSTAQAISWAAVFGRNASGQVDVGEAATNALFRGSAVFRRLCASCAGTHQAIYYKRITPVPAGFSVYQNMKTTWASSSNLLNVDFQLYSTYVSLLSESYYWQFCNYDDPGVGFPRDCSPNGRVGSQWNSEVPSLQAISAATDFQYEVLVPPSATPSVTALSTAARSVTASSTATATATASGSSSMAPATPSVTASSPAPRASTSSATGSGTGTATVTPWPTSTASVSASSVSTGSATSTSSSSSTATGANTPATTSSATVSVTGTASCAATATSTPSRSLSASVSRTPLGTPSPSPMCKTPVTNVTTLRGARGVAPLADLGRYGIRGMYTSGSCASGFPTFFAGPRAVYFLDLGGSVPIGGTLTISTCGQTGSSGANTVLYVGTGCPTWSGSFNCLKANDDAGDVSGQSCAGNPTASTVRLTSISSRVFFVQVGGYLGAPVTTGLAWNYSLPSPTATSSKSATRSKAPASRSGTPSTTRKKKAVL